MADSAVAADGGYDFYLAFTAADRATAEKLQGTLGQIAVARIAPNVGALPSGAHMPADFAPLVRASSATVLVVSLATDVALFARADVKMAFQLAAASAGARHRVVPFLVGVTSEYWEELGPASACVAPITATQTDKLRAGAAALAELLPATRRQAPPPPQSDRPSPPSPPPSVRPPSPSPVVPNRVAAPSPPGPPRAVSAPPPAPAAHSIAVAPVVPRVEPRPPGVGSADQPLVDARPPRPTVPPFGAAMQVPEMPASTPTFAPVPPPAKRRTAMLGVVAGAALFAVAVGSRAISRRGAGVPKRGAPAAALRAPGAPYSAGCTPAPQHCDREEMVDEQGMVFVRVCGGTLCMGSRSDDTDGRRDEQPLHAVDVAELWIGKYEVSNAEYRRFRKEQAGADNMPATGITWADAKAFCASGGHRLPSEAEWEYAARGSDGRKYPWGDEAPDPSRAVFARPPGSGDFRPEPVKTRAGGAGPFGAFNQGGNVHEWVADCYADDAYAQLVQQKSTSAAAVDRPDCARRVVRGGSFESSAWSLRAAHRRQEDPQAGSDRIGLRCVR